MDASEQFNEAIATLMSLATAWGFQVLGGALVFILGLVASRIVRRAITHLLQRAQLDPSLTRIIGDVAYYMLLSVVVIAVFGIVGVETASLITILGASSLAIGLALQGSLSNFASGVMLLLFRPFRVGDYIETGEFEGRVIELGAFSTKLDTLDDIRVVLPNQYISQHPIENWSTNGRRRLDLRIEIDIAADLPTARETIESELARHEKVLKDPAPIVGVENFGDTASCLVIRPWCATDDYWDLKFSLPERVKAALAEVGISMPTPQRDILLTQRGAPASP